MSAILVSGTVRNGIIVPDAPDGLEEGSRVRILVATGFTAEEKAEFDAWDSLGNESWAMMDQWETKEPT